MVPIRLWSSIKELIAPPPRQAGLAMNQRSRNHDRPTFEMFYSLLREQN